jgi:hypothetical protein
MEDHSYPRSELSSTPCQLESNPKAHHSSPHPKEPLREDCLQTTVAAAEEEAGFLLVVEGEDIQRMALAGAEEGEGEVHRRAAEGGLVVEVVEGHRRLGREVRKVVGEEDWRKVVGEDLGVVGVVGVVVEVEQVVFAALHTGYNIPQIHTSAMPEYTLTAQAALQTAAAVVEEEESAD